ncbi:MAG: hypothetical protein WCE94_15330 [Candidatus Methanoperedens sp.]|jgi:hypothetical protein
MAETGISTVQIDDLETRINIQTVVTVCTKDVAAFKKAMQDLIDTYAI